MTGSMKMRTVLIAVAAMFTLLAGLVVSAVKLEAQAAPYGGSQVARCWVGYENPSKKGGRVVGEASFSCLNGYIANGVPNLGERILSMELEATLRMQRPDGRWIERGGHSYAQRSGAGTLRVPVSALCAPVLGIDSRLWHVHVTYAVGVQSSGEDGRTGVSPGDVPTALYGVSGRSVELPCG